MDRGEQCHCHAEAEDPPARGEQRHIHVIEHEHLIAQHRQAVEVLGTLVMGDAGDRRLQARDVRFERDRDPVAEAPLHSGAHRAEEPRRRGRCAEPDGRGANEARPVLEHALAEQHEPPREQRIGQRRQLRQHECREHQPWLVPVAEPAQPPHRGERRRQIADAVRRPGGSLRRGRHRPFLPRPPLRRTAVPADRTSCDSGRLWPSARRASRARRRGPFRARICGRHGAPWKSGAR